MKKVICIVLALMLLWTAPVFSAAVDSIETPVPPPKIEEIIEDYQTIYRLTIYYIYYDGRTAAPTHTEQLDAGAIYDVPSPEIKGYVPTMKVVSGVMPARDMEYAVIYIPWKEGEQTQFFTLEDYETPLGFGATFMNVGVCVE